ncbi:MAG TPA: hypothetical protein PKY29_04310 [Ferruginibacter sp.]|nr:hypothetical protein [Ferruginibacter sp.]HRQ20511.1 hypothetical protein [Ferruginibacter sp.]
MANEINYQTLYEQLKAKVKLMREAQQAYFRSNKDFTQLRKSKALEKEVDDLLSPPKRDTPTQATIDWLAK